LGSSHAARNKEAFFRTSYNSATAEERPRQYIMWSITIEPLADEDLLSYFRLYRDYFLDTFTDTGLWNEEEICAGYEILAFDLITHIRV
jgi:hypothetical protein